MGIVGAGLQEGLDHVRTQARSRFAEAAERKAQELRRIMKAAPEQSQLQPTLPCKFCGK